MEGAKYQPNFTNADIWTMSVVNILYARVNNGEIDNAEIIHQKLCVCPFVHIN